MPRRPFRMEEEAIDCFGQPIDRHVFFLLQRVFWFKHGFGQLFNLVRLGF